MGEDTDSKIADILVRLDKQQNLIDDQQKEIEALSKAFELVRRIVRMNPKGRPLTVSLHDVLNPSKFVCTDPNCKGNGVAQYGELLPCRPNHLLANEQESKAAVLRKDIDESLNRRVKREALKRDKATAPTKNKA